MEPLKEKNSLNFLGQISYFFSKKRPLSILILLMVVVFGLVSFNLTPKQYNPEIVRPAFSILINYVGATQEEAIDRVVFELVEKIVTVPGVDEVHTSISDDVKIQTTVIFEVGQRVTEARVNLRSQLQQHSYLAKGFITQPDIIEINPETIPVLQVVFYSSFHTINYIRDLVVDLSNQLTNVENVSVIDVIGGYSPTIQVIVDPNAISKYNISLSEIIHTLQESQSRFVSTGFHDGRRNIEFVFDGRVETVSEIESLVVHSGIRIRDIAVVYQGAPSTRGYVLHDTDDIDVTQSVVLAVSKVEGSGAPIVTAEVLRELELLLHQEKFYGIQYYVAGDDGTMASKEIFGLTQNLVTSIVIVVLVLLLFLSVRAAAIVFIAIPLTLLTVFSLGYLFDQTINRITLFALILSLGLLVDSAIVVVENIYSHLQKATQDGVHKTKTMIVSEAVSEVGVGLFLSTVTSVIVFLPMLYITGMMGPYMKPIAFFVPAALIVSFIVAIVITPFIATHLLKTTPSKNKLSVFTDNCMNWISGRYHKILKHILYKRSLQKKMLLVALFSFVVSLVLPLSGLVYFQMLPRADMDQFYVYIDLPVDTQTEYTKNVTNNISKMMLSDQTVVSTQQYIAKAPALDFNGMFKGAQTRHETYQSTIRVNIVDSDNRRESSTDVVTRLRQEVLQNYPEHSQFVRFIEEPPGPPVRATLVAKVSGETLDIQKQFSADLMTMFTGIDDVVDLHISTDENVGRIVYSINHDRVQSHGVSISDVNLALQMFSGSYIATEFVASESVEFTPILLSFPHDETDSPSDIEHIYVQSKNGYPIPITAVLDVSYQSRPSTLYFEQSTPITYVTGEVEARPIIYVVIEAMSYIISGNLAGYTVESWNLFSINLRTDNEELVILSWGGEWEMTLENFRDLGIAMGAAFLFVYIVLVAQYNSFIRPVYILFVTVPLGLVGILWGFFFLDTAFDIFLTATALIGFIALIGLVVNNAIIFLEYVEQSRARGLSLEESLLAAGGARLRPILLTSLTTILGSLTIVSDPVWSGLAWAIVFGLSLSAVLTLVIFPTLLVFFNRKKGSLEDYKIK